MEVKTKYINNFVVYISHSAPSTKHTDTGAFYKSTVYSPVMEVHESLEVRAVEYSSSCQAFNCCLCCQRFKSHIALHLQ